MRPSAARDARVTELTLLAVQAQMVVRFTPFPHFSYTQFFFGMVAVHDG